MHLHCLGVLTMADAVAALFVQLQRTQTGPTGSSTGPAGSSPTGWSGWQTVFGPTGPAMTGPVGPTGIALTGYTGPTGPVGSFVPLPSLITGTTFLQPPVFGTPGGPLITQGLLTFPEAYVTVEGATGPPIIIQIGQTIATYSGYPTTFPKPFPNACLALVCTTTIVWALGSSGFPNINAGVGSVTAAGFIGYDAWGASNLILPTFCCYIAIGY